MNTKNLKRKSILLFETIKVSQFQPQHIDFHVQRANASTLHGLHFDISEVISVPHDGEFRVKVIYDELGHFVETQVLEYTKRVVRSIKLIQSDIDYNRKFLDRTHIDKLFAQRGECDEILIVKQNLITDTSIANIAIFHENAWITPKTPLLKGTVRERLLRNNFIREENIDIRTLFRASKIAFMNAMTDFYELLDVSFVV